jgi:hypothetical protein
MITGVHFLLTYSCNFECDHCFLFCGPRAGGTFTTARLRQALGQIEALGTVKSIYFEGGEPFLYYPLLLEGIRLSRERGFSVGVVTNAYWATAEEDAGLWLKNLLELGLNDLNVSDDEFHSLEKENSPGKIAASAARSLGMKASAICIERPTPVSGRPEKGEPVVGGGAVIRGRASDTLVDSLPRHPASSFTECTHEDFREPKRVHLDPFGLVHLCQGIVMGCIWDKPLGELVEAFEPESHPIAGPLLRGGPAGLAAEHGIETDEAGYADPCHLCYLTRKKMVNMFPAYLAPNQVYGISSNPESSG